VNTVRDLLVDVICRNIAEQLNVKRNKGV
jgi:hypothetical protein